MTVRKRRRAGAIFSGFCIGSFEDWPMMFALTADHLAVRDMARAFADERIAPNALAWDEGKHFPVDVLREAAALGMATIIVREETAARG